jgi:hypothetical protein
MHSTNPVPGPESSSPPQREHPVPTDEQQRGRPQSTARELVESADGQMPSEPGGSVRTALANAMMGMK